MGSLSIFKDILCVSLESKGRRNKTKKTNKHHNRKNKCLTKLNRAFLWLLRVSTQTGHLSAVLTWKWAQECSKGKLACIIDRQVCKSFIQPANGGARSWVALSKISVDTEAVAIGYWNTLPRIFRLMLSRCFYFVRVNIQGRTATKVQIRVLSLQFFFSYSCFIACVLEDMFLGTLQLNTKQKMRPLYLFNSL